MSHRFLDEFKGNMGYDTTDVSKDSSISMCLEASEDYLKISHSIICLSQELTHTVDGNALSYLYTPYKIDTITSITVDGVLLDSGTYIFRDNKIRLKEGSFTAGYDNVVVVYTVGYTDIDLPSPLKTAMFKLAEKLFKDEDEAREGISAYNTNTKTGTNYIQNNLPLTFLDLIYPYKVLHI